MCLIAFAWNPQASSSLTLIANRDELHARAAEPLSFWPDEPDILAGRDLEQGGTWLGVNRQGCFAALTNFREPGMVPGGRSRGELVANFLHQGGDPMRYAESILPRAEEFSGFNLILGTSDELVYLSNRGGQQPRYLRAGVYGLSNALLDSDWPKTQTTRDGLQALLAGGESRPEVLLGLLQRREAFPDEELPDTGVGLSLERMLSPPFICSPRYGTRCSSYLQLSRRAIRFWEQSYDAQGQSTGTVRVDLDMPSS